MEVFLIIPVVAIAFLWAADAKTLIELCTGALFATQGTTSSGADQRWAPEEFARWPEHIVRSQSREDA